MYFAALLARTEDGWEASDTELDDVETLADLADLARESAADDDETVLVFIEQEDAWFGIVRVDGEDDPRIFVSDAAAASRSSYGELLLTDEMLGRDPDAAAAEDAALDELVDLDIEDDGPGGREEDEEEAGDPAHAVPAGPVGDPRLLDDLGIGERELLTLADDALGTIAEALGAADVLETVR
ncbi:hypothetical protein SRB5_38890 [Streptomyces sp. RB5]|uniref:tRNA adenosine deaminase-associated protein n=1 Tax=Streptomyces smaragdinus TaxID=2585196 RepID=A0A7K0CJU6_9ACTN|nr:hypothetical protein [Streptomyces smaragdinus]MQY13738.1 hypothetical protein [Streptomyces smaragdinus]